MSTHETQPLGAEIVVIVPRPAKLARALQPGQAGNGYEAVRTAFRQRFADGLTERDGWGTWRDEGEQACEAHTAFVVAASPVNGSQALAEELASTALALTQEHCIYFSVAGYGYLRHRNPTTI